MASDGDNLENILPQIEAQIVSWLRINADMCYLTNDPDIEPEVKRGQFFITINPQEFINDQPQFTGAGRTNMVWLGSLIITIWSRIHEDRPRDATAYLTDATRGSLQYMRKICDALIWNPATGWQPTNSAGAPSLEEPLRPLRFSIGKGQKETTLRRLTMWWSMNFRQLFPGPSSSSSSSSSSH